MTLNLPVGIELKIAQSSAFEQNELSSEITITIRVALITLRPIN